MKTLSQRILMLSIATGLSLSAGNAMAVDIGLGAKAGTLGAGLDLSVGVTPKLNLRGGFNRFDFNYTGSINNETSSQGASVSSSADYSTTFEFNSIAMLLDYHPFASGFRLTAGAMLNNNELRGTAVAGDQTIEIGNYTSTQGADLQADVSITFPKTAPYLGIGYDSSRYSKSGFSFAYDVGVMFQGEPTATVALSGDDASQVPQADIDREVADINNTLADFTVYPVMNLGLSYTF